MSSSTCSRLFLHPIGLALHPPCLLLVLHCPPVPPERRRTSSRGRGTSSHGEASSKRPSGRRAPPRTPRAAGQAGSGRSAGARGGRAPRRAPVPGGRATRAASRAAAPCAPRCGRRAAPGVRAARSSSRAAVRVDSASSGRCRSVTSRPVVGEQALRRQGERGRRARGAAPGLAARAPAGPSGRAAVGRAGARAPRSRPGRMGVGHEAAHGCRRAPRPPASRAAAAPPGALRVAAPDERRERVGQRPAGLAGGVLHRRAARPAGGATISCTSARRRPAASPAARDCS